MQLAAKTRNGTCNGSGSGSRDASQYTSRWALYSGYMGVALLDAETERLALASIPFCPDGGVC